MASGGSAEPHGAAAERVADADLALLQGEQVCTGRAGLEVHTTLLNAATAALAEAHAATALLELTGLPAAQALLALLRPILLALLTELTELLALLAPLLLRPAELLLPGLRDAG